MLDLELKTQGDAPHSGLLVSNHLSYLDIIAYCAVRPCVFVAKSDVSRWPLFGWLAHAAGTIFVDRTRRCDAARGLREVEEALRDGLLVVLFPEGTSSDGRTVLPFKSSLLRAALGPEYPITAAAIRYALPGGGSVEDEVCYWRDMTLLPHLWNLFRRPAVSCTIRFLPMNCARRDRKQLAHELWCAVHRLHASRIAD
ncbi:MAG TPA: lysophospholipid acyltransferase family protein [Chthoniobacterales bacterium]|nr:lysophospholipid acyltransferase family protein [Chthoniobacterales bacterium]